jgi:hypothetical protein
LTAYFIAPFFGLIEISTKKVKLWLNDGSYREEAMYVMPKHIIEVSESHFIEYLGFWNSLFRHKEETKEFVIANHKRG